MYFNGSGKLFTAGSCSSMESSHFTIWAFVKGVDMVTKERQRVSTKEEQGMLQVAQKTKKMNAVCALPKSTFQLKLCGIPTVHAQYSNSRTILRENSEETEVSIDIHQSCPSRSGTDSPYKSYVREFIETYPRHLSVSISPVASYPSGAYINRGGVIESATQPVTQPTTKTNRDTCYVINRKDTWPTIYPSIDIRQLLKLSRHLSVKPIQ